MRYLIIDAALNGTGIRDKYEGGYIDPKDLGLSPLIIQHLNTWLLKYENEHYSGFLNNHIINELDTEGEKIAQVIKNELLEVKLEYFSDARMTSKNL